MTVVALLLRIAMLILALFTALLEDASRAAPPRYRSRTDCGCPSAQR